jgi:hypothetical protein
MTTAFQYVFDYAESISINKRAVVSQTTTRDQTVRTVSRGGQVWRFDVKLPDGIRWSDARPYIEKMEKMDRFTSGTVQMNNAGYNSWLSAYRGQASSTSGFSASSTGTDAITLTATPGGLSNGQKTLAAGDFIQLGSSGHVYSVAADVIYPATAVTLNRPVLDANATYSLLIGPAVTWTVVCIEFPQWTIFSRDQVSWSGAFKFVEYNV